MSVSSYPESRFFFIYLFLFQITNGKHAFDKPEACSSQGLKETFQCTRVSCISLAILLSLPLVFIGVCLFFFFASPPVDNGSGGSNSVIIGILGKFEILNFYSRS